MIRSLKTGLAMLAGAACLAVGGPALAARPPVTLAPTFRDNITSAPETAFCTVRFTGLKDVRRDTSMVGIIDQQMVQSPADVDAWMRAVVEGLSRRGVTPQFDADSATAAAPTATFSLKMVWLSHIHMNFSAQVVVAIDAIGADGRELHKTYRGEIVNPNWAGLKSEFENAISEAFASALNQAAPDLRDLCRA